MNDIFEKEYTINFFDVDSEHKCKFSSLGDFLWDVIISQSDSLGETKEGFAQNNCIWVLLKYDITIKILWYYININLGGYNIYGVR